MLVYWTIFLVIAGGALLHREEASRQMRLPFLLLAAVPTTLMIGLRWKIGPDWSGYLIIFQYSKLFSFDQAVSAKDPGFMLLNWTLHRWDAPFWIVNLVCGVIFIAGLSAFCQRQPNPWLAFLVAFPYLVIVVAMSGNRQSAALGLLFFALNNFERGRLYRFVFPMFLAALFHGSILLLLPICLLSYTRNGLQRALMLFVVGTLAFYFFNEVFSSYARRYSTEAIQSTGLAYRLSMNALAAVLFLLFQRRFQLDEDQAKLWRNISLCTLAMVVLSLIFPSSTAIDRFLLYLFPLQFFVLSRLPTVLSRERQSAGQATLAVIAYAALVQVIFLQFGTFASHYVPYRSILNA